MKITKRPSAAHSHKIERMWQAKGEYSRLLSAIEVQRFKQITCVMLGIKYVWIIMDRIEST